MRTGPAMFDLDDFSVTSYLDGMAMLSKFDIKDGKVLDYVFTLMMIHIIFLFTHDR